MSVTTSVTEMTSSPPVEVGDDFSPDEIDRELPLPLRLPPNDVGEEFPPDENGGVLPVAVETAEELLLIGYGPLDPDGMKPLEIPEGNMPEEYPEGLPVL